MSHFLARLVPRLPSPPPEPIVEYDGHRIDTSNASAHHQMLRRAYGLDKRRSRRRFGTLRNPNRDWQKHCKQCQQPDLGAPIVTHCLHPNEEEMQLFYMESEERYYLKLLLDSAEPFYPLSSLAAVCRFPRRHSSMIEYFQGGNPEYCQIFKQQWARWKSFRIWQFQMRECHRQAIHLYIQRTHERLKDLQLGFQPVLKWNPYDMDVLSTWLEYWCFEYARYEECSWYRDPLLKFQMYDRFWQLLIWDSVLKPRDSRLYLETNEAKELRERTKKDADRMYHWAFGRALQAKVAEQDPAIQGQDKASVEARRAAQEATRAREAEIDQFQDYCDSVGRWDRAIERYCVETMEYRIARREAKKQEHYLCWIQEQIPLMRARSIRARENGGSCTLTPGQRIVFNPPSACAKRGAVDELGEIGVVEARDTKKQCVRRVGRVKRGSVRTPRLLSLEPRPVRPAKAKCIKELSKHYKPHYMVWVPEFENK